MSHISPTKTTDLQVPVWPPVVLTRFQGGTGVGARRVQSYLLRYLDPYKVYFPHKLTWNTCWIEEVLGGVEVVLG